MQERFQIHFHGMEPSEAAKAAAGERAAALGRRFPDIASCRVSVELLHPHRHQGRPLEVRVDVSVQGHDLAVARVQEKVDVQAALREAFESMADLVDDLQRQQWGEEKHHPAELRGEVVRFESGGRCGFIRTPDGAEYWFGPENVADVPFEQVQVGAQVEFVPELEALGRQARRVSLDRQRRG